MISIDTGILLAIPRGEEGHRQDDIVSLGARHRLAICDAAFAELCTAFADRGEAESFLVDHNVRVCAPSNEALCEAGRRFRAYLEKRMAVCPNCNKPVPYRGTTAVDFLVGALGTVDGIGIVTNDKQIRRIWKDAKFY